MLLTLGLDLGSKNTLISDRKGSIIYSDLSRAAFDRKRGTLIACGSDAEKLQSRSGTAVTGFMERGMVADLRPASAMLEHIFKKLSRPALIKPDVTAAVLSGLNDTACRALSECLRLAGAHRVSLVPATLAAAAGLDLDLTEKTAIAVISDDSASISVINSGSECAFRTVYCGFRDFDDALIRFLRKNRGIIISRSLAESIRRESGCIFNDSQEKCGAWQGRKLTEGHNFSFELTFSELSQVYQPAAARILDTFEDLFDSLSPSLTSGIDSLTLVGSEKIFKNLGTELERRTGIPVRTVHDPEAASRGAGILSTKKLRRELGIFDLYEGI